MIDYHCLQCKEQGPQLPLRKINDYVFDLHTSTPDGRGLNTRIYCVPPFKTVKEPAKSQESHFSLSQLLTRAFKKLIK